MNKRDGTRPLAGRMPANAEWRLLERAAIDMKDYIDSNELKLIRDICQKKDYGRYLELNEYWGLQSIDPSIQPVGLRDACLYQLSSLLRKTAWTESITVPQKENATKKFLEYERHVCEYNKDSYRQLTWSNDPQIQTWLSRIQSFILEVLGPLDMNKVLRYARPGPGGTFSMPSQLGHRYYKYASIPYEVTSNSITHARRLIKTDERWLRAIHEHPPCGSALEFGELPCDDVLFRVVPGNRIDFVPKSVDIARTIGLEPSMNVMLQLGVDGHVRKRLLKFGININDQQINKTLAQRGSVDNSLDTLDLAGASDTISMRLIEKVFPREWSDYLSDLRSDQGSLPDGTIVQYQKLSSMGNGYTFAIETLVFAACVYAVNPEVNFGVDSHVYGDDIIVPSSQTSETITLLNLCGFIINTDKSFINKTFTRESCGGDFYRGKNIRPIFLSQSLSQLDVFAFYSFHNRLKQWFSVLLGIFNPSSCELLVGWCDTRWALFGPPDEEDTSSYLAVPDPIYGRNRSGTFPFDRAIAQVKTYQGNPSKAWRTLSEEPSTLGQLVTLVDDPYFQLLSHRMVTYSKDHVGSVLEEKLREAVGSQFDITRKRSYNIWASKRSGCALAWPAHYGSD